MLRAEMAVRRAPAVRIAPRDVVAPAVGLVAAAPAIAWLRGRGRRARLAYAGAGLVIAAAVYPAARSGWTPRRRRLPRARRAWRVRRAQRGRRPTHERCRITAAGRRMARACRLRRAPRLRAGLAHSLVVSGVLRRLRRGHGGGTHRATLNRGSLAWVAGGVLGGLIGVVTEEDPSQASGADAAS